MSPRELRKAERARLRRNIADHLEDFARQYSALEFAMHAFGDDFDLARFKAAFNTKGDLAAYHDVQAVERAIGRVQNYVGDLAQAGVRLTDLPSKPEGGAGFRARQAFEALRDTGIIDAELCGGLVQAQKDRSMIEHEYVRLPAGKVHETAVLVRKTAAEFIELFRAWIESYLD